LRQDEQTAIFTVTIVEGVISFADDRTVIYISPTAGNIGGSVGSITPEP
jgi:hypothetical protein